MVHIFWECRLLPKLLEFICRYEYSRSLFDIRAADRFPQQAKLFENLAKLEFRHQALFSQILQNSENRHNRKMPDVNHGKYCGQFADGKSKNKIWARFLFAGKSAKDYDLLNTLAFCAAAEFLENSGYVILDGLITVLVWLRIGAELSTSTQNLLREIAREEKSAEKRLIAVLKESNSNYRSLLRYWYIRAIASMLILLITRNK